MGIFMMNRKKIYDTKAILLLASILPCAASGSQWVISEPVSINLVSVQEQGTLEKPTVQLESKHDELLSSSVDSSQNSFAIIQPRTTGVNAGDPFGDYDDFSDYDDYDNFKNEGVIEKLEDIVAWVKPLYSAGEYKDTSEMPGFNTKTTGVAIGANGEIDKKTKIGAVLTLDNTYVNIKNGLELHAKSLVGSLNTHWKNRSYFFSSILSMGKSHTKLKRMAMGVDSEGKFETTMYSLHLEAGKTYRLKDWAVTPSALFNYTTIDFNDYTETLSTGTLNMIKLSNAKIMELGFGIHLRRSFWGNTLVRGGRYTPELSLKGYYDMENQNPIMSSRIATGNGDFLMITPNRGKFRMVGEVGLTITTFRRWELKGGYQFNMSSKYRSHGASLLMNYKF